MKNLRKEKNESRQLLGHLWDARLLHPDMDGHLWFGRPGEGIPIYEGTHKGSEGSVFVEHKEGVSIITIEIPVNARTTSSE